MRLEFTDDQYAKIEAFLDVPEGKSAVFYCARMEALDVCKESLYMRWYRQRAAQLLDRVDESFEHAATLYYAALLQKSRTIVDRFNELVRQGDRDALLDFIRRNDINSEWFGSCLRQALDELSTHDITSVPVEKLEPFWVLTTDSLVSEMYEAYYSIGIQIFALSGDHDQLQATLDEIVSSDNFHVFACALRLAEVVALYDAKLAEQFVADVLAVSKSPKKKWLLLGARDYQPSLFAAETGAQENGKRFVTIFEDGELTRYNQMLQRLTQTDAEGMVESDAINEFVNNLSLAQDVAAAEKALEASLVCNDLTESSAERLAACYYNLRLRAAVRDGGGDAFDSYAARLIDDMRRSDACANVSIQACRNLGFYDAERAKRLYLELVAEFASSKSAARRGALELALSRELAPKAGSDALFDPTLFQYSGEEPFEVAVTPADAAKQLAKLKALFKAFQNATSISPFVLATRSMISSTLLREYYDVCEFYERRLRASDSEIPWNRVLSDDVQRLLFAGDGEKNPDVILDYIAKYRSEEPTFSYDNDYKFSLFRSYFRVIDRMASLDGTKVAFERLIDQTVAAFEFEPSVTASVAIGRANDLKRVDARYYDQFIEKLRASDVPKVSEGADYIEGVARFKNIVGQSAVLEGVCEGGEEIMLDDYRGKVVLLYMNYPPLMLYAQKIPALPHFDKYRKSGFNVVLYDGSPNRKEFMNRSPRSPYRILSRSLTQADAKMGRKYVDLSNYYGLGATTKQRLILIDSDGNVVAVGEKPDDMIDSLKNLFPDVD